MIEVLSLELDETQLVRLAQVLALKLTAGDCVALFGDLGAGKTTFARALIRAALGDGWAEVPSPTFAIEQVYDGPRGGIAHYDLYRLDGADDLAEIGLEDALDQRLVLIEWPERAGDRLPVDRIELDIGAGATTSTRRVRLRVGNTAQARMRRAVAIHGFLDKQAHWRDGDVRYLQGDASTRAYARIVTATSSAVLMDAPDMHDGGKDYARIARLAQNVLPFYAIDLALERTGIAVPHILAHDLDAGLLLLDDLGDLSFGRALAEGFDQAPLWSAAVDVLLALREKPLPTPLALPDGRSHVLARFDRAAIEMELDLLLAWFWPAVKAGEVPGALRDEFKQLWAPHLAAMMAEPPGLFLRDYHSPNLFWRPDETGIRRVGVIDFQDALAEPWAYDLVSLLQDARVDVAADLEALELARYVAAMQARDRTFDAAAFRASYARFGAQRNTRLVGLWVRLLKRDGKPNYLQHMPRTWGYLERNLAHPDLADLKTWYDRHFPQDLRRAPINR